LFRERKPTQKLPEKGSFWFGGACWKKSELIFKKIPRMTSDNLCSGGAGIHFPPNPLPFRPPAWTARIFCEATAGPNKEKKE